METASKRSRISRIDLRYRHLAQDVPREGGVQEREVDIESREKEAEPEAPEPDEPLLAREEQGQPVMGRAHRMFHRRQAPEPNVLTVVVDVIATVDANSNVIALQTLTPALPSVPTAALPSVPSVPPFPSDLTVPAYPWPSGVPSILPSSQVVISSPLPTSAPVATASSLFPSSQGYNSTASSTVLSSSSSLNSTSSTSSSTRSSTSSSRSTTSSTRTPSPTSSNAGSTSALGGGAGAPAPTVQAPAETSVAASASSDGSGGGTPTPTVVGSVVGSIAGFALILAIILILIKRHKRKQRGGALQLSGNDPSDNQPIASSGQQMATRSSTLPAGAAAFLNRFSGASKSTADTSTTGERSFQRISGRKLPSAFSEGMTSEQFARGEGTLSGSSFYRDDHGFYGGPGPVPNKEFGKETGDSSTGAMGTKERFMPSPARTPVVHHAGDAPSWGTSRNGGGSTLSPPQSPNPAVPPRGTLGRSHPSHDGSRGSRFTEDV